MIATVKFPAFLRFPLGGASQELARMSLHGALGGRGQIGGALGVGRGAAATQSLLLDSLTAHAAFSLRKLRTAYVGSAVLVRRSSDNAEQAIGFSDTDFDVSAFSTFIGAGSGYVKTWYDQSGNSRDASQTTTARQPAIALSVQNSKPMLFFDTTALNFSSFSFTLSPPYSLLTVLKPTALGSGYSIPVIFGARNVLWSSNGSTNVAVYTGSAWRDSTQALAVNTAALFEGSAVAGTTKIGTNGTRTSHAVTVSAGQVDMHIGVRYDAISATYSYHGYMNDLVLLDSAIDDATFGTLETDINTYYAIY